MRGVCSPFSGVRANITICVNNQILTCLFLITEFEKMELRFVDHKVGFDKRRTVTHTTSGENL
jgi:hypothetical protein